MSLSPGTRLGPYEIGAPLGAGGMGEVYRARDTRLDRTVAIKVLPPHAAADADFRARFEREARVIASLNHPNICAIYDVGHQDGTDYLVMELLEGESLADRLKRGPVPVDQALVFASQIADALDRAHRAGVIHRDLKPGNVMLARGGGSGPVTAKLLDFGLAKPQAAATTTPSGFTPTSLPTTPHNNALTAQGMILGTFQYMAPEQLEGREADARTDIFAFGCVLYEMLTGRRAFEGKSQASLIAAIITSQPDPISSVQPLAPASLDFVVSTCLAKDPEARFQSAHDLAAQLRWVAGAGSQPERPMAAGARPARGSRLAWALAAVATIAALALAVPVVRHATEQAPAAPTSRFLIQPPEGGRFDDTPAISADGRQLVYVATDDTGIDSLWLRPLDALEARQLPGTEDASYPFWSPDSRFIAFFAGGELRKIDVAGGRPQTICAAPLGRGGTWNADGVIVFAGTNVDGLLRVAASGGTPVAITTFDAERRETSHRRPHFLPDGRHFLYVTLNNDLARQAVFIGALDSPDRTMLFEGADTEAQYAAGYLLFGRKGGLMAQPFDARRLVFSSPDAIPVVSQIAVASNTGTLALSVSPGGTLVYRGGDANIASQLTWFDREGRAVGTVGDAGAYDTLNLSPDDSRVAVGLTQNNNTDIWVVQLARGISRRLTFDPASDDVGVWSPDGATLVYGSETGNVPANVYTMRSAGGQEPEPILKSDDAKIPATVTPDGKTLVYSRQNLQKGTVDVWTVALDGDHQTKSFLETNFNNFQPALSPDGRWLAYASNETGRYEVYLRSFPEGGATVQVSAAGGAQPRWRRDGRELFYLALDGTLTAVPVRLQAAPDVGAAKALFRIPSLFSLVNTTTPQYDVTADGQRFLVIAPVEGKVTPLTIVLNWAASIGR